MTPSHPITSGNRKWIYAQAQYLKKRGHDLYYLYISCPVLLKDNNDDEAISCMKDFWEDHLIIYRAGFFSRIKLTLSYKLRKTIWRGYHSADDLCPISLPAFVKRLHYTHRFDGCIVNYYWLTKIFKELPIEKKAINTHDCFSYKDILCGKYAWMTTSPNEEGKALQRCNYIFALQKNEALFFKHLSPKSKVLDVYCFFENVETPFTGNHNILFLSSDNQFNKNGLKWFLDEVFSLLLKEYSDATLIIGGSISESARAMNRQNVQTIGLVENQKQFYSLGDVCINPTYEGTGLKIKTFESVSYGKVTIARVHSTDGIYDTEKSPILASDSQEDWISFFEKLWNNPDYIKDLKNQDRDYIDRMNKYLDEQYNIFTDL